jgi:hypothetical protein
MFPQGFPIMIKPTLIASLVLGGCFGLALVGATGQPGQAQTAAPAAPPSTPATPAAKVSPDELQKFAKVVKQLLTLDRETETQMVSAIEQTGLPKERFLAIYLAKKDPKGNPNFKITADEEKKYTEAELKLTEIQKTAEAKQNAAIAAEGFNGQRFNQIMTEIQSSPQLQQDLRKILQS